MNVARFISRLPAVAGALALSSVVGMTSTNASAQSAKPTILLVHGAWADSSSWNGVVERLLKDGYDVRALPNTLRGLDADAAVISTYVKTVQGPVVLVGHSYGGSVISVASANAPNVKALVYVDAFMPEPGESIESENAAAGVSTPPDFARAVPIPGAPAGDVDLYINPKYFGTIFASGESPAQAALLSATHRPFASRCITDKAPAVVGWKSIPTWYVLGEADKVIPPAMQLGFATRGKSKIFRVPGGDHPSMIGHPDVTVAAIRDAVDTISR